MTFASADQVARAIVTSADLFGEDAEALAAGRGGSRARIVAFAGLIEAFPDINKRAAARGCGFAHPAAAPAKLIDVRQARWWDEARVDEVVGALVAEHYGDRAR